MADTKTNPADDFSGGGHGERMVAMTVKVVSKMRASTRWNTPETHGLFNSFAGATLSLSSESSISLSSRVSSACSVRFAPAHARTRAATGQLPALGAHGPGPHQRPRAKRRHQTRNPPGLCPRKKYALSTIRSHAFIPTRQQTAVGSPAAGDQSSPKGVIAPGRNPRSGAASWPQTDANWVWLMTRCCRSRRPLAPRSWRRNGYR